MNKGIFGIGLAFSVVAAHAAFDMASLYTQTVKQGTTWSNIETKVDALALDISVDHGVVTTTATFTYTPGNGYNGAYVCRPVQCIKAPCPDICGYENAGAGTPLDSLETSTWGSLGDNSAITEMYLWVGDTKVRGELQERGLASAQYEDIVKRRRDPALIETWGSGYYSLRIFPNQSGKSRKLEIRFVQGMENEKSAFATVLPIIHSLQTALVAGTVSETNPHKNIGTVSLKAYSVDGKTYGLDWPGLGAGKFGPSPLALNAAKVEELKEGTVSGEAAACAGCLTAWTSDRGGKSHFGVKALLLAKEMTFEAQPGERCVILDVDASDPAAPDRARKLALLSLKAYAQAPYVGNLAFSDGKGKLDFLFPAAAVMDAAHLAKASEALKAWMPIAKADAHTALESFAQGRETNAPAVAAILINNDPYNYYKYPDVYDPATWEAENAKAQKFEALQSARADMLSAVLNSAHTVLFGFWNDYHLSLTADATGGFNLGGIYGWIYPPYYYGGIVDARVQPADAKTPWYLPPLFGPGRPDYYGLQDLKVTTSGIAVTDPVVLQETNYWRYGIMLDKRGTGPLAKSASLLMPGYGAPDSSILRIGGRFQGSGKVTLRITGKWGGLRFAKEFTAELSPAGSGPDGASLWAYQQTEAWGRLNAAYDVAAAQKLGMEYHVVNRQVSLLALEPGVPLWTDLPAKADQGKTAGASDSKNMVARGGGMNLDSASLEDILAAEITGVIPAKMLPAASGALWVRTAAGAAEFSWALPAGSSPARFRILDVTGRAVADLAGARTGDRFTASWKAPRKGTWILRAESGKQVQVRKLALGM